MNRIAVVTINHNTNDDVIRIFKELKKQVKIEWIFIVIDDNSDTIHELESITDERFILKKYPHPFSLGYANKYNFAFVEALKYDMPYIYKMHTDMEIHSDNLLFNLVEEAKTDNKVVCVGPTIYNGLNQKTWGPGIIKTRCGWNFTVHESYLVASWYLTEFNGFQDEIFTWFGEEMDFFVRIQRGGFKTSQVDDRITHFGGITSGDYKLKKGYYRAESTLIFLFKHNSEYSIRFILITYYKELKDHLLLGFTLIKQIKLLSGIKSFYFIFIGFISGLYKITSGKVIRYKQAKLINI